MGIMVNKPAERVYLDSLLGENNDEIIIEQPQVYYGGPVELNKGAGGTISFGTHGFYFEFKQTGTSANSSGIGADTSGNNNHHAVTAMTSDHITLESPTFGS